MRVVLPYLKFATKEFTIGGQNKEIKPSPMPARRKIWLSAASLAFVALLLTIVWKNLSAPSNGTVALPTREDAPVPQVAPYQTLTTDFYTINYSGRYSQQPTDLPPAGIIDRQVLSYQLGNSSGSSTITIDIKAAPDGGIVLDSDYIKYTKTPGQYKLSNKLFQNDIVDIARSTKGRPETDAMWLHGSFVMNINLATDDHSQNIDSEMKDLLSSVQWRKQ